jgi:non-specific serine/threonine protein kinase
LLDRLVDRLTLLSRDSRDLPARLRTMRDAVGWSYDLLSDEERRMFRRLSVFAGGCTIGAAEKVLRKIDERPATKGAVFEGISSLLDKSLLVRVDDRPDGIPRFGMLETIRAYAFEQLEAHGEEDVANDTFVEWFLETMRPAYDEDLGPKARQWVNRFEAEKDNLRAALRWALDQRNVDAVAELLVVANRFWIMRGYFAEGLAWIAMALTLDLASGTLRSQAWIFVAAAYGQIYDQVTDDILSTGERGLELARRSGGAYEIAQANQVLGLLYKQRGDFAMARQHLEESLRVCQSSEFSVWPPLLLNSLGQVAYLEGDIDGAAARFDEAMTEFRALGNTYGEGVVTTNLAKVARARGNNHEAIQLFQLALDSRWEHRDLLGLFSCLRGLATVLVLTGRDEEAVFLDGAAETLRESIGAPPPIHGRRFDEAMSAARNHMGEPRFERVRQAGSVAQLEAVVPAAIDGTLHELLPEDPGTGSRESAQLTPREIEVLSLVRDGLTNREIGERLFVSERTAQTHVQHILDKLDVSTRAAAAATALQRGLI